MAKLQTDRLLIFRYGKGSKDMLTRIGILMLVLVIGALCLELGEKMSIPGVYGTVPPAHEYLKTVRKKTGDFLFAGRRGPTRSMSTRQYARLVSQWIGSVGLDPHLFGTHPVGHP